MISENWIYATVVQQAKAMIAAGGIGEPFMVRSVMDMEFRALSRAWPDATSRRAWAAA